MKLALLLALQTAPQPPPAPPLPVDFDLADYKPPDPCETGGAGSDIVVCAPRPRGTYDYEKWARIFREDPLVAETGIGEGTTLRVYTESATMPGGQISKRVMVGVKVKF